MREQRGDAPATDVDEAPAGDAGAGELSRARRRRAVRVRAALGLGVAGLLAVGSTLAAWTDSVTVAGTSVTGGTLDLRVNNVDSYASSTLSMPVMVPGSSSAEVIVVRNAGTAKLRYAVVGSLTGADAAAFSDAGSLRVTVVKDGTRTGTGSTATCTGGTTLASGTALTTGGASVTTLRGPLASGASESLCVQVALALDAPSLLQGKTAGVVLTATGTSEP